MKKLVIQAENISKQYRLGEVGTGTLSHDLNRFWSKVRGKEDPFLKIGDSNDRSQKGTSDYVWSLRDINFEIEQGDAVGIIGRNGAGKSTLLKLLSKVTKPTTGSFKINGRIASLLEVGTGFNPEMTGRENVYLNGAILGMRRQEITRKFDEIVDFSGVERYIDTPVKRYSSGMYVRLAFAVAAHLESEILIIDEVLAVGDAEFQKKCLGKMGDVSKGEGRTVLFVSHNIASVKTLCNQGIVLENGKLIYNDTIDRATDYYLTKNLNNSNTIISERKDRKGNGLIQISEIQILNSNNVSVNDLIIGQSYTFIFKYSKKENIVLNNFIFVIQIMDSNEQIITTIGSDELGIKFNKFYENDAFKISIPFLNLREGNYSVYYLLSQKESLKSPHIINDSLLNAFSFTVLSKALYDSGIVLRPRGYIQQATISLIKT